MNKLMLHTVCLVDNNNLFSLFILINMAITLLHNKETTSPHFKQIHDHCNGKMLVLELP